MNKDWEKQWLILDVEVYLNFFLIVFKRLSDGKILKFELSDRNPEMDLKRIEAIMRGYGIITFNGNSFDIILVFLAISGADNAALKDACDRIIQGRLKSWESPRIFGIEIPRIDHIDLIEPQPNPWAGLKLLNGRLHGKRMQDLPYPPSSILTHEQMDNVTDYCVNDHDATELLFNALEEPLKMRETLGAEFEMDFRSKSDAQIGEAIVKKRSEQALGRRIEKVDLNKVAGTKFRYEPPEYLSFDTPQLQKILERIRETDFFINYQGKVNLPDWLGEERIAIGETAYQMGIGGLHSTEKNRSVYADDHSRLFDFDVASYYPAIILGSGLYPQAIGPVFLEIYAKIRDERIAAKRRVKDIDEEIAALELQLIELDNSDGE